MKNKLFFLKNSLQEIGNQLLKEIISKDIKTNWAKTTISYMNKIKLNLDRIKNMKLNAIKNKIHEWIEINGIKRWNTNRHLNYTEKI